MRINKQKMEEEMHTQSNLKSNEENKQNMWNLKRNDSISMSTNDQYSFQNHSHSQQFSSSCLSALNISDIAIPQPEHQLKNQGDRQEIKLDYNNIVNYKLVQIIGKGTFGTVYKAIFLPIFKQVAIKIVNFNDFQDQMCDEVLEFFQQQVQLLEHLQLNSTFKFTCEFYGGFKHEGCGYIILELLDGFTLQDLIQSQHQFNASQQRFYFASIILALEELHNNCGCIHRDIKPQNIMVLANGTLLILDFGCAKKLKKSQRTSSIIGTCEYFSPSRFMCDYSFQADFWSFGVMAYEIITKKLPFCYNGMQLSNQQQKFRKMSSLLKKRKQVKLNASREVFNQSLILLLETIFNLIINNQANKQVINQIKNSEYFKQFDWDLLVRNKFKPPKTYSTIQIKKIKQNSQKIFDDF